MKIRYVAVAERLVEDIKSGRYPVDGLLPSEPELTREFDCSRSTIRAALAQLQTLGLVERRQGAGTRVRAREAGPLYVHSMAATGDLMQFAGPSRRQVHETEALVADEELAPRLDARPGRRWLRIGQTRHLDTLPKAVCWTDVYIAAEYADIREDIAAYGGLIYTLLEQRFDVTVSDIIQSIRAVGVDPALAARLEVAPGSHALELTRRYRDAAHRCLIVSISVLPADNYTYEILLKRQG